MSKSSDATAPPSYLLGRRRSTIRNLGQAGASLLAMRRMTRAMSIFKSPVMVKLENTYQLGPKNDGEFSAPKVKDIIEELLKEHLDNVEYNQRECKEITREIASDLKNRVKEMKMDRYKIVVNVVVGQSQDQGFHMASRGIWFEDTDNWACASYKNSSLFAVATVHGLYFE